MEASSFWDTAAAGVISAFPVLVTCEAYSLGVSSGQRRNLIRLSLSFFLFGLINNGE